MSRVIGASIMEVVYGIELTEGDKFLSIAKKGADIFSKALTPGRYLVELFPVLAHLPTWFPGAQFKRDVAKWLPDSNAVPQVPYNTVKRAMVGDWINIARMLSLTIIQFLRTSRPKEPPNHVWLLHYWSAQLERDRYLPKRTNFSKTSLG